MHADGSLFHNGVLLTKIVGNRRDNRVINTNDADDTTHNTSSEVKDSSAGGSSDDVQEYIAQESLKVSSDPIVESKDGTLS